MSDYEYVNDIRVAWREGMKKGPPHWLAPRRSARQELHLLCLRFGPYRPRRRKCKAKYVGSKK